MENDHSQEFSNKWLNKFFIDKSYFYPLLFTLGISVVLISLEILYADKFDFFSIAEIILSNLAPTVISFIAVSVLNTLQKKKDIVLLKVDANVLSFMIIVPFVGFYVAYRLLDPNIMVIVFLFICIILSLILSSLLYKEVKDSEEKKRGMPNK